LRRLRRNVHVLRDLQGQRLGEDDRDLDRHDDGHCDGRADDDLHVHGLVDGHLQRLRQRRAEDDKVSRRCG